MERIEHNQEPTITMLQESNGTNGTNGVEQSFININNKNKLNENLIFRIILY